MRRTAPIIAVLVVALLSGCGCGDDRSPSSIDIDLTDPLAPGTYSFTVCVDDECTQFTDVPANGELSVGGMDYLNITDDAIYYYTFHAIPPGQHHLAVILANTDGTALSFDGDLDFEQVDRCHDTDSRVTLDEDQLTAGAGN